MGQTLRKSGKKLSSRLAISQLEHDGAENLAVRYSRRLGLLLSKGWFDAARALVTEAENALRDKKRQCGADPLDLFICELGIRERIVSTLDEHGIIRVSQLLKLTPDEFRSLHGLDCVSLEEVREALAQIGLSPNQGASKC